MLGSATTTITRAVTVAAGVFVPDHRGELTQYLPFELVDEGFEQTRTVQGGGSRPCGSGVFFARVGHMFPRLGYARVWEKLTAGLVGTVLPGPSEKALRDVRRRLGPAPMKACLRWWPGRWSSPHTPGMRFGGLRTVAFDSCNSGEGAGHGGHRSWLGRICYWIGWADYLRCGS